VIWSHPYLNTPMSIKIIMSLSLGFPTSEKAANLVVSKSVLTHFAGRANIQA